MKLLEIVARFEGERNRWPANDPDSPDDFTVIGSVFGDPLSEAEIREAKLDPAEPFSVKGIAGSEDLERGVYYRFFGGWTEYFSKYHGRNETQFTFRSFVPHVPRDPQGVATYLANRSKGCGIGPRKALDLVKSFGADCVLAICREHPGRIAVASGISHENAIEISRRLKDSAAIEATTLEVEQLIGGRKFPRSTTRKAIRLWGNRAAEVIAENPYLLMTFRGCGFKLADRLWLDLGKDPGDPIRQALCVWYTLASNQSGDTWSHVDHVVRLAASQIGSKFDPRAAIIQGKELGKNNPNAYGAISTIRTMTPSGLIDSAGKFLWLAEGKYAAIEDRTAEMLATAITEDRSTHFTRYEETTETESTILDFAKCARCSRLLTAPEVSVLGGKPYGPTCIGYVDPDGKAEKLTLVEWCEQNPEIKSIVYDKPVEIVRVKEVSVWPETESIEGISDHQRAEIEKSLSARVGLLGGSPGTGKTFTVAALIKAIIKAGAVPLADIAIGAPTGKAAVRLTESLAGQGVNATARTWHSLLGVAKADEDGGEWSFLHGKKNPWSYKILIGDETSMVTLPLIHSVLSARAPGCHVLLVGDVNQLPPVGSGAPFRDAITAGLAYGELREIQRNSGGIVEACAAIRDNKPWTQFYTERGQQNLWITGDSSPESQKRQILDLIAESGGDPIWDCQVLSAINEKSPLSRQALNEMLQGELNPAEPIAGTVFRLGDKVICLGNDWYTSPNKSEDGDGLVYVANGEIGRIEDFSAGRITVRLDNPERYVYVPIAKKDKDSKESSGKGSWDLAYAVSCHKYQGSEQKTVITALDSYAGARMICDRSWIYTAISRAKRFCYLVGTETTAQAFCRTSKMHARKTFLAEKIRTQLLEIQSEGL